MKEEEIFKKAVYKAIENGLPILNDDGDIYLKSVKGHSFLFEDQWWQAQNDIIFGSPFAEYFWGKKEYVTDEVEEDWDEETGRSDFDYIKRPAYENHLMMIAISGNRIKYLEKFL